MSEKQYNDRIEYIYDEIKKIKEEILDETDIDEILDSFEIDKNCYEYIDDKDEIFFRIFCDLLKSYFREEKYKIDNVFTKFKDYDKKNNKFNSFLTFIKDNFNILQINKLNKIKNNKSYDSDSDSNTDLEIEDDDFYELDIIKPEDVQENKFKLRDNQTIARENNKKNNFGSGIHNQVTGAGKSLLMMLTINDHYILNKNNDKLNKLYIITCPRIEVLNKMFFEESDAGEFVICEINKKIWKDNNIIDLDEFKIIDRVNYKSSDKLKLSSKKPNILIVNSDYFKIMDEKNYIDYDKLNFVIFDECHGISAKKFYDLLHKIKFVHKKHIIGFSATPVRDNAEDKVKKIFSKSIDKDDKHVLNIISNYDIMTAICHGVVLPPSYTIVEIKKTCKKKIGKSNKDITEKVITDKLKDLPYKKIICWCGSIAKMKEWYMFFNKRFPELKLYCSTSKDSIHKKEGLDTDYDEFCETEKNAVLLTVHRCREGSDIKNLDMGVYLDHVKKRGILVCIQTVGRILRPDIKKLKRCGFIIDTFINDGEIEIEVMTAQRIISYYEKVLGLTSDDAYNDLLEKYKKMKEMFNDTSYDENSKMIKIKIDDNIEHDTVGNNLKIISKRNNSSERIISEIKLELITKNFDWSKFTKKINSIIDKNFDMNEEESLKIQYQILKEKIQKYNKVNSKSNSRLSNKTEYKKYAQKNKLVINPEQKFINHGWKNYYDFLGIDTSKYPDTFDELKNICKNHCLDNEDVYITKCNKYELPEMPEEISKYGLSNILCLFEKKIKLIR
jgi:superfamily II DNA or RNA helicase